MYLSIGKNIAGKFWNLWIFYIQ